jgi:hypothetical protein
MTISFADIRDGLSPVQRAALDASMLEHASGEWLHAMLHAFFAPLRRTRSPRTALHLLGPWAPPRATTAVRVTYSDGTEVECSAHDIATGEWILYMPTGETLVTSVTRVP